MTPPTNSEGSTLLVFHMPLFPAQRARLEKLFTTVHHCPNPKEPIPDDILASANVMYGIWGNDDIIGDPKRVPNLRFIQVLSAGAEHVLKQPVWKLEGSERISLTTAAGVHAGCVPQYFIATLLALYHKLQEQILITQNEKRWASEADIGAGLLFVQELRGKTVGVLGYGHLGRESARLAAAFGAKVITANTSGTKKPEEGYVIPGTGDADGSIPSEWFSTKDPKSFASFLSQSDVLLAALPSTPETRYILSSKTLPHLKHGSVFINIGRGDLIETPALVAALDEGQISGAALDVTDPEPLPEGHTLYGRKNVIVTPHLSGRTVKYFDIALDLLEKNVDRWREGKDLLNQVDPRRGY